MYYIKLTAGVLLNIRQPEAVRFLENKKNVNRNQSRTQKFGPGQNSAPVELLTSLLSYPHSQLQEIIKSLNFEENNGQDIKRIRCIDRFFQLRGWSRTK